MTAPPRRGLGAVLVAAATVGVLLVGCSLLVGCYRSTGPAGVPVPSGVAVAGYLVPWDSRSRATAGAGVLREVNPVWFQPTGSGEVTFTSAQAGSTVASVNTDTSTRGVAVAPSISNFHGGRWDGALVAGLIGDPSRRAAHVAAIADLVRTNHWPGIDIDYESLPATSRSAYSAFVTDLAAALHKVPARLSVTLHAKTSEPGSWSGARAQDWHTIGAAVDEVRVMAYDYSTDDSQPGPIAPASWVDKVLRLATSLVPPERVVLGLPTYGYDWATGVAGRDVQWADVQAIALRHRAAQRWDSATSSPWLRYVDDQGRAHTIWYENAASLEAKLVAARRHGVTRFVLWRLGGEDPQIWPALRAR